MAEISKSENYVRNQPPGASIKQQEQLDERTKRIKKYGYKTIRQQNITIRLEENMKEYSVWVDEAEKIVSFHEVDTPYFPE